MSVARPAHRRTAIAVLLLSGSNAFRMTVQFLLFPVLARLLEPEDYGLMALVMPVLLFALTIGEGGMGPALVRAPDPTGAVASTMFWTALGTGALCAAVLALGAPFIADSLSHAAVKPVLYALAPILVLSAVCSVPSARIQKTGDTWIFALGDVLSTIGGAATALYGALTGWGAWSLVGQQLAIWIIKTAVLLGLAGAGIRARPSRESFFYLMRHGAPMVGANLLSLFSNSIDAILTGRFLGVASLGFYSLAYQIVRIPETLVNGPVFISFLPAVAKLDGNRPAAARLFLATLRMMFSVVAPLMLGLALTADLAVPLLLGPRWDNSATLLMLLAPSAVAQTLGWVSMGLLLGRGRSVQQFHIALLNAGLTLGAVVIGLNFGLISVAAAVSLAVVIGSCVALIAAKREVQVTARELLDTFWPPLLAVTIMTGAILCLRLLIPNGLHGVKGLILLVGTGMLLYVGAMRLLAPDIVAAAISPFRQPRPALPQTDRP